MSLEKILKKLLTVILACAFLLQQTGFAFASTDISTWSSLKSSVQGIPGEYNVTTALTADPDTGSKEGTIFVTASGHTITGATLTQNTNQDALFFVSPNITLNLGNSLVGSIKNVGTITYTGSSLSGGSVQPIGIGSQGLFIFGGTTTNANTISQGGVEVSSTGNLTNNGAITATTVTNSGTINNSALITGAITNNTDANFTSSASNLDGAIANAGTLNLNGGTNANEITGAGRVNFSNNVTNNAEITQTAVANTGALTNNSSITGALANSGNITGTGTLTINATSYNTGTIEQNLITNNFAFVNGGQLLAKIDNTSSAVLDTDPDNLGDDVKNDGTLNLKADGTLTVNVTGTGETNLDNAYVINEGTISQNKIDINANSVLVSSASDLKTTNKIVNQGIVNFTAGTNANTITGTGRVDVTGYVINNGEITQTTVGNSGVLTNNSTITANLENNNDIAGTGTIVTGTGVSYNKGILTQTTVTNNGTFDNTGHIIVTNLNNNANATLTTNADLVNASITNNGTVNFTGGTNTNAFNGTGRLDLTGYVINNATIGQGTVTSHEWFTNNGAVTAILENTGTLDGTGDITTRPGTSFNNGTLKQNSLTNQGTFTNNGQMTVATLTNNPLATFNNNAAITGDVVNSGTINNEAAITGNFTNNGTGIINSTADNLIGTIASDGILNIAGGTVQNTITGTGTMNITKDLDNSQSITQGLVTNSANMYNYGAITANFTNSGSLDNYATITGAITNNVGASIDSTANNLNGSVTNNGTLYLDGGTTQGTITGTGITHITDNLTNNYAITQATVTNDYDLTNNALITAAITNYAYATITSSASNLLGDITNDGTLNLDGGTNANKITGEGTTNFSSTVTNNGAITQTEVTNSGVLTNTATITGAITNNDTGTINSTATNLVGEIANEGILNLAGGATQGEISGTGTTNITADLTNGYDITQSAVTNSGVLDNTATITGAITNSGTINSTADNLVGTVGNTGTLNLAGGTTQGEISGTGTTNITADLINDYDITQSAVTNSGVLDNTATITGAITNSGTINSTATNLVGTVDNAYILNLAGGTTQGAITGAGVTYITEDLTNNYAITQTTVENSAKVTNNAAITATNLTNTGTISGKASNLIVDLGILNNGTLVFDSASTGASNITGTGDVQVTDNTTLTGTNDYAGGTLINGATLAAAGSANIGTGNISFANNGILDITTAGTLSHTLLGQASTDNVSLQNDAALTFDGIVGDATDFHKLGTGTLTLAMASNAYTGNTYVDAGTLIGNTANINNKVIGTAGTTVNFTDTTNAELNEIETAGTFVQSGNAVLNVSNNAFSANQVEVNAGTFAANRALTATTLNVNNGATLRGNGNITGTVNVKNGAKLTPGNSIDTLTITGNLNLANGSTTVIEVDESIPANDKIVVTGNATVNSGANLEVSNASSRFFEATTFNMLEANNISGEFNYDGTVTGFDTGRIHVDVDYTNPTKVVLTAQRTATDYTNTIANGLSHNQREAARAIDAISTGFGGDITNALLQIEKLGGLNPDGVTLINPNATFASAMSNLGGVLYANSALTSLFHAKTSHVYDRIAKRNHASGQCENCHNNVWVEYYHQYDKAYSNANSSHYNSDMNGTLVGYDRSYGDILLGVYGGFGKNDLHQSGDTMKVEDTSLGVYGGYMPGDWIFKGTLLVGYQDYVGKRNIAFMGRTAKGSYNGSSVALDLEGSYNFPLNSWVNVKPFIGLLNSYSHQRSFKETGADSLNLSVGSNEQFNAQARLGVKVDGTLQNKLSWYGSVAVKQFIGNDYAKLHMSLGLPGTNMDIISAELGKTSFSGQVGLNYALNNAWSLYGNFDTGVNNRSANCYGNIGIAYIW